MKVLVHNNICFNVDNENDIARLVDQGALVLSQDDLKKYGMIGFEYLVGPSNTNVMEDGGIVFIPPEPEPLDTVKARKLGEINFTYQQAIATLTPTYPDDERLTFDKQEQEARAWLDDNSTSTPFVDALAAGRKMDKAELISRIIAKADAFTIASGSLTGQRQRYEDLLDAAETAEDVAAIIPEYSLPGGE